MPQNLIYFTLFRGQETVLKLTRLNLSDWFDRFYQTGASGTVQGWILQDRPCFGAISSDEAYVLRGQCCRMLCGQVDSASNNVDKKTTVNDA